MCVYRGGGQKEMRKFLSRGWGTPPIPTVRKILVISTLYTCSKGHGFEPVAFLGSYIICKVVVTTCGCTEVNEGTDCGPDWKKVPPDFCWLVMLR